MTEIFNRFALRAYRQMLRNDATEPERILWTRIRKKQINNCRFRRQFSIGSYVVDFYSPEIKLVIEIDGDNHSRPEVINYDNARTEEITRLGINLVRFQNAEILDNVESVVNRIKDLIDTLRGGNWVVPNVTERAE